MADYKAISSEFVQKSFDAIRASYLKQLNDLLIQGSLFFGVSFIRLNVETSLNIIESTVIPFSEEEKSEINSINKAADAFVDSIVKDALKDGKKTKD